MADVADCSEWKTAAPDRRGAVIRAGTNTKKSLAEANAGCDAGLDLAEISADLLETGQLIAMNDPPTRTVDLLRKGAPNVAALRAAIEKYTAILEPNQLPPGDPRRSRPPLTLH
jgi:hypothetical protein